MATSQWRLILRKYLAENPKEKRPIVAQLGTSVRSLERWVAINSETDPDPRFVPKLVNAVPGYEEEMELSLKQDYPDAFESANVDILPNIPSAFYARLASTRATAAPNLNKSTNFPAVLRQIGNHLDPREKGLLVLFARCVSPLEPGGRITGLAIHPSGYGTGEWRDKQIKHTYMIGSGSLCAHAIVTGGIALYPQDVPGIDYASYPILYGEDMRSCAAFPVLREGYVAGALFVGAKQEAFFTEARRELFREYAYLFALALRDNEFYPVEQIDLRVMPSIEHQSEIFFRSQQFLEEMAKKYPDETPAQIEQRARDIFHEYVKEEIPNAKQ